jgi:hypothetical protein
MTIFNSVKATRPLNIDIEKELGIYEPPKTVSPSGHKINRLFIKGPIPLDWLQKANDIGGSTGIVAFALWFYAGLNSSNRFRIDARLDRLCCLTRQTRDQNLRRLQFAGLIKLFPKHGAYPTVEILDSPKP